MPQTKSKETCADFQNAANDYLIRHRSALDIITKLQETVAHVNRAFAKSVTRCGCVQLNAKKQIIPPNTKLHEITQHVQTHYEGQLCPVCREVLSKEIGHSLFYIAALCNLTGLDLQSILEDELNNISILRNFSLK